MPSTVAKDPSAIAAGAPEAGPDLFRSLKPGFSALWAKLPRV